MTTQEPTVFSFVLMCPKCKAIVGGGQQEEEDAKAIMKLAADAGLTALPVLANAVPPTTHCGCPKPSPLSKFTARMALLSNYRMEVNDGGTWKPYNGKDLLPSLGDIKPKTMEEAEAAVKAHAAKIEEATGMRVATINIESEDPLPLPGKVGQSEHVTVLKAFRVGGFPCQFQCLSIAQDDGTHDVVVLTEHGFQVWPADTSQAFTCKGKAPTEDEVMQNIVGGFLIRLNSVSREKFDAWLQGCLEQRAKGEIG